MATDIQGPAAPASVVRVEGLTRVFDGRAVLDGLRLDVRPGEFVAVLGRSGCGGSTLVRVLAGLDRDIEGTVLVPRRKAAVFQEPRPASWKRAVRRHALLGLPGRTARTRRAAPARALLREPDLLLLDDPFGALGPPDRRRAQRLVGELWQRRGCAVLLVTHDAEEAVLLADRVLVLDRGVITHETAVGLDRPRDSTDPRFTALRAGLAGSLTRPGDAAPSA